MFEFTKALCDFIDPSSTPAPIDLLLKSTGILDSFALAARLTVTELDKEKKAF
jgi:hypothetical protein